MKNVRFSGDFEFVKYEWRFIPEEKVEAARGNPYLEIRVAVPEIHPQPEEEQDYQDEEKATVQTDDLAKIKGVGMATASVLASYGFGSFESLAYADPQELAAILENDNRLKRLDAQDLIAQARELL